LFEEEYSKLLDRRVQAKLHWLRNPRELNGDVMKYVRRESSRHSRNKEIKF
jgi:hypothetical protein